MSDREKLVEMIGTSPCVGFSSRTAAEHIADHLIENGVTFAKDTDVPTKWISVKDRLPEVSGQYIVCCDDSACSYGEGIWYQSGVVVCAEVDVGIVGGICWEWREGSTIYDLDGVITHWMPLPELPEE